MSENQNNEEEAKSKEYEDICYICRRPESVAGPMIHIQGDIQIVRGLHGNTVMNQQDMHFQDGVLQGVGSTQHGIRGILQAQRPEQTQLQCGKMAVMDMLLG